MLNLGHRVRRHFPALRFNDQPDLSRYEPEQVGSLAVGLLGSTCLEPEHGPEIRHCLLELVAARIGN